jgi:predicted aspartyl protease
MYTVAYKKYPGSRREGPYIHVTVCDNTFEARLETGTDITVIPRSVVKDLVIGELLTIRQATDIVKVFTYIVTLKILDREFTLPVLTSDVNTCIIGLDILQYFRVEFLYNTFSIESV